MVVPGVLLLKATAMMTNYFRASRMNRQGVNIFSDGSVLGVKFKKTNGETLGIYLDMMTMTH